jgi:ssDNA-binding Zn-finger/Zn-ribbon topoisomerase 1
MDRDYVERPPRTKIIKPTELGFTVTGFMENHFKDIVDLNFTSEMEDRLDGVESSSTDWKQILRDFYGPFKKELDEASNVERIKQKEVPAVDDDGNEVICEKCGKPMLIKTGRFGQFMACSGFPECRNTKPIIKNVGVKCPECGGDIVQKRGKSGKLFYGCSNYPKCNVSFWDKPVNRKCPVCGKLLVEKHKKNTNKPITKYILKLLSVVKKIRENPYGFSPYLKYVMQQTEFFTEFVQSPTSFGIWKVCGVRSRMPPPHLFSFGLQVLLYQPSARQNAPEQVPKHRQWLHQQQL